MPQVNFNPGDRVLHKAYRVQAHQGTVLAADDSRAWAGSLKFPELTPDPEAVKEHVQKCKDRGLLDGKIPVLWDSGIVHWHKPGLLKLAFPQPKASTAGSSKARKHKARKQLSR